MWNLGKPQVLPAGSSPPFEPGVETISVEFMVTCADREEGGNVRLNCSSFWRSAATINGLHSPVGKGARWLALLSAQPRPIGPQSLDCGVSTSSGEALNR
jgi:hypothetical protein